jgi:hypothetical protein
MAGTDLSQAKNPISINNDVSVCLRDFSHVILIMQMVGLPFQSEIVATLTIGNRIIQQSLECCCLDHLNLLTFRPLPLRLSPRQPTGGHHVPLSATNT